jgi:hypothetical protein
LNIESLVSRSVTHGQTVGGYTPEYRAWLKMRERCLNPNTEMFPAYGGRGIKICERWKSFENFYLDMGRKPSRNYSLDRVDVDGDYEPGNCRWATANDQARNKRNNTLTTEKADAIRNLYSSGRKVRDIAREVGCGYHSAWKVAHNIQWTRL